MQPEKQLFGEEGKKTVGSIPVRGERADGQGRRPRVVALGAGFSGLFALRVLANQEVDVTVVDRHNYHTFFPFLYQIAAAELAPGDITYPIRRVIRKWHNIRFILDSVESIDFQGRIVRTGMSTLTYDYLIVSLGSQPFFFGVQGADHYAYPLKTVDQAIALRNQILYCFERASCEPDPQARQPWMTFAIVGGGPTGVEFAGAMAELIKGSLQKNYPYMDLHQAQVVLIEAGDYLLTGFPTRLGDYARSRLEKMGVEVRLKSQVAEIGPHSLRLADQTVLPSNTITWTAGVRAFQGLGQWGLPTARNGQVEVEPTLQAPGHPEVYVVGDVARVNERGKPLSMVAQVAIQQGSTAAHNILRQIHGESPEPFHYRDLGMLAVIGRNAAAADIWGRQFTGFIAWLIWVGVHIVNLIGFRNRLLVLFNWAWVYFSSERNVDLMIPTKLRERPELKGYHAAERIQVETAGPVRGAGDNP